MIPKKIIQKCKRIKVVITDVDGVLTDGGMYFSEKGELLKKFNTRDGMAIELLHKFSIKSIFLTGENSKIVLLGDVDQIDTPYIDSLSNGLTVVAEKFKDEKNKKNVLIVFNLAKF